MFTVERDEPDVVESDDELLAQEIRDFFDGTPAAGHAYLIARAIIELAGNTAIIQRHVEAAEARERNEHRECMRREGWANAEDLRRMVKAEVDSRLEAAREANGDRNGLWFESLEQARKYIFQQFQEETVSASIIEDPDLIVDPKPEDD